MEKAGGVHCGSIHNTSYEDLQSGNSQHLTASTVHRPVLEKGGEGALGAIVYAAATAPRRPEVPSSRFAIASIGLPTAFPMTSNRLVAGPIPLIIQH